MGDLRERSYLGWFDHEIEADKSRSLRPILDTAVAIDCSTGLEVVTAGPPRAAPGAANDNRSSQAAFAAVGAGGNVNRVKEALDPFFDNHASNINALVSYFHGKSKQAGWWDGDAAPSNPYVIATKLMLAVSELSEAMEGLRKDLMDDKLPHRKMGEVELGDALIRILDLAGALGYDLGGATMEKDAYNDVRADHKPGARMIAGGKRY